MEFLTELGYLGMFLSAFLAATILPFGSEIILSALLFNGFDVAKLILVATVGNVLGSLTNYVLGFWMNSYALKRWLNISDKDLHKAEVRFKRYGLVALCFAWVPIIGDPLTVFAGVLRIKLIWFIPLVTIGKLLRYMAIAYITLG